ncbi:diguanylate cyclase [Tritonibacter scottomollicae]|uniref:diguanylate cyclase n=1 Tax=Tritonibacter scottomollicae TaxID=483013 RepID=UPI003AA8676C
MKISTITNWAYGVTVVLTAVSGIAFIAAANSAREERRAVSVHLALNELGEELAIGAELRTDEARLYVMRGDLAHLQAFDDANTVEHQLEATARAAASLGATEEEQAFLKRINTDVDALEDMELEAIKAYQAGDAATAQEILFGAEHYRDHVKLIDDVRQFRSMVRSRTDQDLIAAQERSNLFGLAARIMLSFTAAVFLAVLYFVLRRRVSLPLSRMTGIVKRLASQDFAVEVPLDGRRDEIGELNSAIHIFRENGLERERLDAERRRDIKIKDLILQMMHRLQACQSLSEMARVLACYVPQMFPELSGGIFLRDDETGALQCVARWQSDLSPSQEFETEACWGLRRGRTHGSNFDEGEDMRCAHLGAGKAAALCIPLSAQGDTVGLLSFDARGGDAKMIRDDQLYLELIAENIALTAVNLKLRDQMTQLVERDPLTGLLNRRSLDAALIRYATGRLMAPLACLMLDIDWFKRFNDEFGHDAGDAVMQSFSGILARITEGHGTCYRFGGEEFVVLLPGYDAERAHQLAEDVRQSVASTSFSFRGQHIDGITVSIGLAIANAGDSTETLRARADAALLRAKAAGRNRVEVSAADGVESEQPR